VNVAALVNSLFRRRILLWTGGDDLIFDAPAGEMTEADLNTPRSRKAELVAYLTTPPAGPNHVPDPRVMVPAPEPDPDVDLID
jgi:hypothetical protein